MTSGYHVGFVQNSKIAGKDFGRREAPGIFAGARHEEWTARSVVQWLPSPQSLDAELGTFGFFEFIKKKLFFLHFFIKIITYLCTSPI